jgi:hypothetical protein
VLEPTEREIQKDRTTGALFLRLWRRESVFVQPGRPLGVAAWLRRRLLLRLQDEE